MFYRLSSGSISLGLSFIITFFPVCLMFKVMKWGIKMIIKAAKVLTNAAYKLMLNYQI